MFSLYLREYFMKKNILDLIGFEDICNEELFLTAQEGGPQCGDDGYSVPPPDYPIPPSPPIPNPPTPPKPKKGE